MCELHWESERYVPPEDQRPAMRNQPQRYTGNGCAVKRLDHINLFSRDVVADRTFMADVIGFRLYEINVRDNGTETGAWMSLSIAAHELIYTLDPSPLSGRLHHAAFWVDTREECLRAADIFLDNDVPIEAAPSKHAAAQGFFLYGIEPGGNRVEVTTGGYFVYDPEFVPVVRPEAELLKGMAWGVQLPESFRSYGTPVAGAGLAQVVLHGPGVALGGVVGILTGVAQRATLAHEVPEAVELDTHLLEAGVLVGLQAALGAAALEELVLLGDEALDVVGDGLV